MFPKSFIVFGILAISVCQGATLSELINNVKEVLGGLEQLVGGVISDAIKTVTNLVNMVKELKDNYLQDGINTIQHNISTAETFIRNATEEAARQGVDISKCVAGQDVVLQNLSEKLVEALTTCINSSTNDVFITVNHDIKTLNEIVSNITAIPVKLSKCLISLRPNQSVTNLLTDITHMFGELPDQISDIVKEATSLVDDLTKQLLGCVNNIFSTTASQTTAIITDIGTCVDDVISGSTGTTAST